MTDNEIIKELEKWLELSLNSMVKNALDLINRQKEDIENLRAGNITTINKFASKVKLYPNDFSHYDFDEFVDEIAENLKEDVHKNG